MFGVYFCCRCFLAAGAPSISASSDAAVAVLVRACLCVVVVLDERIGFNARRRLVNVRNIAHAHFFVFYALADRLIIFFYKRATRKLALLARQTCDLDRHNVLADWRRFAELMKALSERNDRENCLNVTAGKKVARIGQEDLTYSKSRREEKKLKFKPRTICMQYTLGARDLCCRYAGSGGRGQRGDSAIVCYRDTIIVNLLLLHLNTRHIKSIRKNLRRCFF